MVDTSTNLKTHFFALPYTKKKRRVRVLLPNNYSEKNTVNYPVLYMHDGQNLLFDQESFSGNSWKIIESLQAQVFPDIIVVAIDHADTYRLREYAPFPFEKVIPHAVPKDGGNGQDYANWVVTELKPFIDLNYRTKKDFEHSFLAGSSMGGLITAYTAAQYPNVFGGLGIFSIASWTCEKQLLSFCQSHPLNPKTKLYLQVGTNEGDLSNQPSNPQKNQTYITNSLNYYKQILAQGLPISQIDFAIIAGAQHTENVWAQQFPHFLNHLLKSNPI
ncbi:alpha/beta hydrolase [Streptococcus pseudoporcinus]|uniref:Esterase n=1 Tax=Streptococcus pseudoporcinus LQ 940-04 TaxID=875093 RepID=G5K6K0_9STRE|nr:alpha/beta hydrolase-fold protein [Streptococcus pseudoporcinus]EFR44807.1 putative esterase [Streptococcus pseudoporcinus SPIN 20026]EHI65926.1 putative esterase [Streptococcus pseudoporcinus LQ 940-04]VEF94554.1 esterase [Streptococcus pseudoporcinus]